MFFIYQYRQSLLASVEYETISVKIRPLAFWCPCTVFTAVVRPPPGTPTVYAVANVVRHPSSSSSIEPRAHPTRTTAAADVNGPLDRNGDVLSVVYGRLGLPCANVSTLTPPFWAGLSVDRGSRGPLKRLNVFGCVNDFFLTSFFSFSSSNQNENTGNNGGAICRPPVFVVIIYVLLFRSRDFRCQFSHVRFSISLVARTATLYLLLFNMQTVPHGPRRRSVVPEHP